MSLPQASTPLNRSNRTEYVEVVIPLPLDNSFTYRLPSGIAYSKQLLGVRVLVPFGSRNIQGFICSARRNDYAQDEKKLVIKQVQRIIDGESLFSPSLFRVLCWAAEYYHEPLGQVLDAALPQALRKGRQATPIFITKWRLTPAGKQTNTNLVSSKHQRKLLDFLQNVPASTEATDDNQAVKDRDYAISTSAIKALKIPQASVTSLENKKLIKRGEILKMPIRKFKGVPYVKPKLNSEQQSAVDQMVASFGKYKCFLLEGLTNSGKTEVYIEIIRQAVAQGKQALYLVPEIGLSPQSLERLEKSLAIPLGVSHSSMTANERLHNYLLMKQDLLKVLIGTRSAAFVPLAKPGCIIIDEEHDSSYKQSSGFRYNCKHLLIKLASELKIPVVLGSATPSLESFHNAASGKYHHIRLTQKINPTTPPQATLLPMKGAHKTQPNELSVAGIKAIRDTLAQGGQALIFINRRGFSPKLQCSECGWQAICSSCDRPMTLHRIPPSLSCHLCERNAKIPNKCPECNTNNLQPSGLATQSIETLLRKEFPKDKIYRIDRDTMRKKDSLIHFYRQAQSEDPCILVGTQILAKGHDFTNVRLGVILNCDAGLFSNDFHNIEQLAQLITQVIGRVGRHGSSGSSGPDASTNASGKIIIPTYNPDSSLLNNLIKYGYAAFAKEEMNNRNRFNLPPYHFMAYLRAEAPTAQDALDFLSKIKEPAVANQGNSQGVSIFGPLEASLAKKNDLYRFTLIIKSSQRTKIHNCLSQLVATARNFQKANSRRTKLIRWHLDLDPFDPP